MRLANIALIRVLLMLSLMPLLPWVLSGDNRYREEKSIALKVHIRIILNNWSLTFVTKKTV